MKKTLHYFIFLTVTVTAEIRDVPDKLNPPFEPNFTLRITAKVITEDRNLLDNADVTISIVNINEFEDGSNDIRGKTDKDGKFSAEGVGRPVATIIAEHEGYYPSSKTYGNWDNFQEAKKTGKYIPWDPVIELTLKKIGNPIPMIVRLNSSGGAVETPAAGKELGFDLFEYDWVAPHGKGKIPDLIINLALQNEDQANVGVNGKIRFGNEDDGLIPITELTAPESLLKYPRIAADDGYVLKEVISTYPIRVSRIEAEVKEPVGYMFRIRTQRDKSTDKIVSAFYGKIVAPTGMTENVKPFVVFPFPRKDDRRNFIPYIQFSYYLNPTPNNRNLEYDQRSNLAPEASGGSVYAP